MVPAYHSWQGPRNEKERGWKEYESQGKGQDAVDDVFQAWQSWCTRTHSSCNHPHGPTSYHRAWRDLDEPVKLRSTPACQRMSRQLMIAMEGKMVCFFFFQVLVSCLASVNNPSSHKILWAILMKPVGSPSPNVKGQLIGWKKGSRRGSVGKERVDGRWIGSKHVVYVDENTWAILHHW